MRRVKELHKTWGDHWKSTFFRHTLSAHYNMEYRQIYIRRTEAYEEINFGLIRRGPGEMGLVNQIKGIPSGQR